MNRSESFNQYFVIPDLPVFHAGVHNSSALRSTCPRMDADLRTTIRYGFTHHALDRLKERTKLSPEEVLVLLEGGAYERLVRRMDKRRLYANPKRTGLTLKELREQGVDTLEYCYKHVLIWSEPDQIAFTLIIALKSRHILTVLRADDRQSGVDWSDKVTPEAIQRARTRQAESRIPSHLRLRVHARVSWMSPQHGVCGKNVSGFRLTKNDLPLEDEILQALATEALQIAEGGYDIRLQLISKENGSTLLNEYQVEKYDTDQIDIQPITA